MTGACPSPMRGSKGSVVMFAYYYPPLVGVASERMAAFARLLPDCGWQPTVIAPRDGHFHKASEPTIENAESAPIRVVRTPNFELSRLLRSGFAVGTGLDLGHDSAVRAVPAGRVGGTLRDWVRALLYIPDAQVGWLPSAVRAARRAAAKAPQPAVLYSSSVPYSAHIAAWLAARSTGLPWIAEFRDPWSEAPEALKSGPLWRRQLDERVHRAIVNAADHVVVTTETTRENLVAALGVPRERVSVVTNGFGEVNPERAPDPDEALTLLYAGSIAPGERVEPLLEALDDLQRRHGKRFRLRVLGPTDGWNNGRSGERPWLELKGLVTPANARRAMASASANVLLRANELYRSIVPGKLFEYLGSRRPILAALPHGSEMARIAVEHGDIRLVAANRADAFLPELERLISEHEAGSLCDPRVPPDTVEPLSRRATTERLAAILDRVADRRGASWR